MNELLNIKNQREFGKDYVKILTKLLIAAGKDSSGNLIKSLNYRIQPVADEIVIELIANDYFNYVDEGRKPGTYPPLSAIKDWVRKENIDEKFAFPIARNIFKFGIKPTKVGDKLISEIERDVTRIEENIADNIEEIMIKQFNEIK